MKKLEDALDSFKDKRILVLGDIILDKFCWGKIEKLNPEQHAAPNVNIESETYALGGAANVANNVASMGGNCRLYGILGKDLYGGKIRELCEMGKISLFSFYNGNATIMKQRIMAHGQQITRLNYGEKNRKEIDEEIKRKLMGELKKEIGEADFIILSDYEKGFFSEDLSQEILNLANSIGVRTLVDSKQGNINFFENCTIIKSNKHEASARTGIAYSNGQEILIELGKKLSEIANSKYAVITCGEDGAFSYDRERKESAMIGTKARKIADVAGAGDTFAATLTLGLSSGLNIEDASIIANYAAGNVVEKQGVVTTNIDEIRKRIEEDLSINL